MLISVIACVLHIAAYPLHWKYSLITYGPFLISNVQLPNNCKHHGSQTDQLDAICKSIVELVLLDFFSQLPK